MEGHLKLIYISVKIELVICLLTHDFMINNFNVAYFYLIYLMAILNLKKIREMVTVISFLTFSVENLEIK